MPKNIHFEQPNPEPFSGNKQEISLRFMSAESTATTIKYGHAEYQSDDTGWCRFTGFNTDVATSMVTASVTANTSDCFNLILKTNFSGLQRSVKVDIGTWKYVSGDYEDVDIWDTATIIQNALPVCMVKEDLTIPSEQHSGNISVVCDSDNQETAWSISSDVSWIRLTNSFGTGNSINGVSYSVLANTEGTKRVGTITISVGDRAIQSFKITQEVSDAITRPAFDIHNYLFEHYADTEVIINVLDPQGWGWLATGYLSSVTFKAALNPNNSPIDAYKNLAFDTHNIAGIAFDDGTVKRMDGTGNMEIKILFPKSSTYLRTTQCLKLLDTAGEEIDAIYFDYSDTVETEYLAENPPEEPEPEEIIWPTGSYLEGITFISLDVGDYWGRFAWSHPIPKNAKDTTHKGIGNTNLVGWYKGKLGRYPLGLATGVTGYYTYATKEDGSHTPYTWYPIVIWDKDNPIQEIQFESHRNTSLQYGETKEIRIIKRPGTSATASTIQLTPHNPSMYSVTARDSEDGKYIILTVTAKYIKGRAIVWVNYGSCYDLVYLDIEGGDQIKQASNGDHGWQWSKFVLGSDRASLEPVGGITLEEGGTHTFYDQFGTADGTRIKGAEDYHLVVRGDRGAISVGDIVRNPDAEDYAWYMFSVKANRPGVAFVDVVYNEANAVKRSYSVVVRDIGTTEVKSIRLTTTTKKAKAGKEYNIFYNVVPRSFSVLDSNGNNRPDVSVYHEVEDPNNCLLGSSTLIYDGNGVYHIQARFDDAASGQVGFRVGIRDAVNDALSPTYLMTVSPSIELPQQSEFNLSVNTLNLDISGGSVDLSQYVTAPTDSYYFFKIDSSKSGIAYIGTDGHTLVPNKNLGTVDVELYAQYKVTSSSGIYSSPQNTGKKITINFSDLAENEASSLNVRFRVRSVEYDRSLEIWRTFNGGYSDAQEQLKKKYGVYNIRDLVTYDDPNGIFDGRRLSIRYENENGKTILNSSTPGYYIKNCWEEGTYYACLYYGFTDGTNMVLRDRIPINVITSIPGRVVFRNTNPQILIPDATGLDFTRWYTPSYFWRGKVIPIDGTVFSKWEWGESAFPSSCRHGEILQVWEYNPSGKTLDEKYRFRIAGFGLQGGYNTLRTHYVTIAPQGTHIHYPVSDDVRGSALPTKITLTPSKSSIRRGEYTFIKVSYTPDIDFGMGFWYFTETKEEYSIYMGFHDYGSGPHIKSVELVAATRRGLILRGAAIDSAKKIRVKYEEKDGAAKNATCNIIAEDSYFPEPGGELKILAQLNSDGTVKDDQTVALSGATVAGWATSDWETISVTETGYLRTYKPGSATIYAVTTDGRLASMEFTARERPEPVITRQEQVEEEEEEEAPVDTTTRPAGDSEGFVDIYFNNTNSVVFDSPSTSPISRTLQCNNTTVDLNLVRFYSTNPSVVSVTKSYNSSTKTVSATMTPVGKGEARVYFVYGGYSDYLNTVVNSGENLPNTSVLEYTENKTGATLNLYEFTTFGFRVLGSDVNESEIQLSSSTSGIEVQKGSPFYNGETYRIFVTLKSRTSGEVYVRYRDSELIYNIVNRYSLEFEDVNNFALGIGATRNVLLYPLDDLVKLSEISVYSKNEKVSVDRISEAKDSTGRRVFIVPIRYLESGHDTLVASRRGDSDDVYLEFDCEAKSVRASAINFNLSSINLRLK